jgi:hypothetical protein
MRMAPFHVKRKFWWELIFISVLLFLLAGVPSQRKRDAAAATMLDRLPSLVFLAPVIDSSLVAVPALPALAAQ